MDVSDDKATWAMRNADTLRAANEQVLELTKYLNVATSSEVLLPIAASLRDLLAGVTESSFDAGELSGLYQRSGESFDQACQAMERQRARSAGAAFELALYQYQEASAVLADQPPPPPPSKPPIYQQGVFWVGVVVAITVLFLIF
jgi:hypothetical protein